MSQLNSRLLLVKIVSSPVILYVHPDDQTQPTFDKPFCYFQHFDEREKSVVGHENDKLIES